MLSPFSLVVVIAVIISTCSLTFAQVRITPAASKGGTPMNEIWKDMPAEVREGLKLPQWPVPSNLKAWEKDRVKVRATVIGLLGDMPARPDPKKVKIVSREDKGEFFLERIEFHNGVDSVVPGYVMIPKDAAGAAKTKRPCIVALHEHGGSKDSVCLNEKAMDHIGTLLVKQGYIVAAIDGYFHGERIGKGPAGTTENKGGQEMTLSKLNLWMGRCLWGMQLRDEQCLLDYLETRGDIDMNRLGVTGMSMGCTRSWWLAAIDDRPKGVVGVACFTRYSELIARGSMRYHGIYYFVPGMLQHFDTEAIHALIAPRPHLELSGDQDPGAPVDGIETLERILADVYKLYGKPENFRSVLYTKTGHEYLPEMRKEMVEWFAKHLK
ncbi:MAG: alpha/beta hydrolase family protein [Phycisphaeraceae bacterium]